MARSTVALALLGLLAFAAVAMADNAEMQKKHHGGYDKHTNKDKDSNDRRITLQVVNPDFMASGKSVGSTAVLTFDLVDEKSTPVAKGRLTAIATEVVDPAFVLNGQLSIVVIDGRYTDTIITAAGPVGWDGQQVEPNMNTMVVTGASGLLAGAEGTIVLMGADDANKKTVTFNLRLNSDAGMHGKTN